MKKLFIIILSLVTFWGCTKKSHDSRVLITGPVSIKKIDIPKGADPSVPADLGGAGFKGNGWITNDEYVSPGSSDAIKGGGINLFIPSFLTTTLYYAKDAGTEVNFHINSLMYETLLELDDDYQNYVPRLATHWKISEDNKTYWLRLNPEARFADGSAVTSEDVIATYELCSDETILFPIINQIAKMFEKPVAESKYIVKFSAKVDSTTKDFSGWKYFFNAAGSFRILPASYIKNIKGSDYLEKYRMKYIPGTGPYLFDSSEIVKGSSITLRRRSDYWAEKENFVKGLYNFDFIKFEYIQSEELVFEKFKKGEIDLFYFTRAADWNTKLNIDEVEKGLILKREVYNKLDAGVGGICINLRKPLLDDIRIRKALAYAYNRELFNSKLFYNSYNLINSFFPGSVYQNPSNPMTGFNLDSAKMLLQEAGWSEKNSNGYLVRDGKILEFTMPYRKGQDRYFTIYQEDLAKIGIKLNIKELDPATIETLGKERNFELIPIAWTTGDFPTPESQLGSEGADKPNSLNWCGIKDKKIDSLIYIYNGLKEIKSRISVIRLIDSIAVAYVPYIFNWYPKAVRIAFHNKFGFPDGILYKKGGHMSVLSLWYYDINKAEKYWHTKDNAGGKLDKGEMENKFWLSQ